MCSLAIKFEIHLKDALETTSLLIVFMVVAVIVVMQRYRGLFNRPMNGENFDMESYYKKPVPVENEETNWKVNVPFLRNIFKKYFSLASV